MAFFRTLRSHHFHTLVKHQKPLHNSSKTTHYLVSNPQKSSLLASISHRTISLSAQFGAESIHLDDGKEDKKKTKKPLNVFFKEAVGLSQNIEKSEGESDIETGELKKKLRKLEEEVRKLNADKKEGEVLKKKQPKKDDGFSQNESKPKKDDGFSQNESKPKGLYSLFTNKAANSEKSVDKESSKVDEPMVFKELSTDMVLFATHLYKEGYFNNANFLPRDKFDDTCFQNNFGRDYLKFATEKFGKDNQEIAKWLSGSDLKKVALFGCPSLSRKNVFSAKRLRTFFRIPENTVCSRCALKQSCKFPNQSVWKGDTKQLNLAVVMRVIVLYALEAVPQQLVVPDEIKASVSRLLKEVVNLSQTIS
ncbi:uncharacterized protein LOC132308630 [Cornus florida]|uniref:uncharacterized protein LOC132308630 n=1 Tax=Cornus florida TaxID=4283 RepID=UPI00289E197F|nr:uncharacterized protein LOC132308630 [Cornus florida]XP_059662750.1 uncharacterized protein LOC132308630 [Cornus florida]